MPDVVASILGTFLGALLGIPAGLAVNYAWRARTDRERRNQLRQSIINTISTNEHLVGEIRKWTQESNGYTYFNVDLSLLEATASMKYEIFADFELCGKIDHLSFELTHLSRKVNALLDLEFNPPARMAISGPEGSMYNILRPRLIGAIGTHLDQITKTMSEVKTELEKAG